MSDPVVSPHLSQRATSLLKNKAMPEYIVEHFSRVGKTDAEDSKSLPYTGLCVAENHLMNASLLPKLTSRRVEDASAHVGYDNWSGNAAFRQAVGQFMSDRFIHRVIDPDRIAIQGGAGSVLETLFWAICDAGDGCLLPTPYYAGFVMDLQTRFHVKVLPVPTHSESGFSIDVKTLDEAYERYSHGGTSSSTSSSPEQVAKVPVKAAIICSPNNPLGRLLSREELLEIVAWGRRRQIHLVFDEIYAMSIHDPSAGPFVSVGSLLSAEEMGDLIHIVYGFSKDFGVSGLRAGVLYSENRSILTVFGDLGYWAGVSTDTQRLLTDLLLDKPFLDDFFAENSKKLAQSYAILKETLSGDYAVASPTLLKETKETETTPIVGTAAAAAAAASSSSSQQTSLRRRDVISAASDVEICVPILPAAAGIFAFIDLRQWLRDPTWAAEHELWRYLLDTANVNFTPGKACNVIEPGWFRVCFATVSHARLKAALEKVRQSLQTRTVTLLAKVKRA